MITAMAVDRRLADQAYEDRKRELRLKGWGGADIARLTDKEFKTKR